MYSKAEVGGRGREREESEKGREKKREGREGRREGGKEVVLISSLLL